MCEIERDVENIVRKLSFSRTLKDTEKREAKMSGFCDCRALEYWNFFFASSNIKDQHFGRKVQKSPVPTLGVMLMKLWATI